MTRGCTECGKPLPEGSNASRKTCSDTCRSARSRRIKRQRQRGSNAPPGGDRPENEVYDAEQHELAAEVAREELRPIVREQISEEVVAAVGRMLGLSAHAVEVIERDLDHTDPQIRMKAAALVARYSMSDRLMPELPKPPMEIELTGMPTPAPPESNGHHDTTAEELPGLRVCHSCNEAKTENDFEANAPRCRECQARLRGELLGERSA